MAEKKIVGFEIEISGQKEIVNTTKLMGLLNTQLILVAGSLAEVYNNAGTAERQLSKFGTSAEKTGKAIKGSFETFEKGNKTVKSLGNGYLEVKKSVKKAAVEFKDLEKVKDSDNKSTADLIKRNKVLKKVLADAPRAGTKAYEEQKESIIKLTKEYSKNNDEIKKFRKELRTGTKQSEVTKGSIEDLRIQAAKLKKEYIQLSPVQRKFSLQGRSLRKNLIRTTKRLKKLEEAVGDGRRSVGLYGRALKGLNKQLLKAFVGRSVIGAAVQVVGRLAEGLKEIVVNSEETGGAFGKLKTAGAGLQNSLKTAGTGILKTFGSGIAKVIENISFVVSVVSKKFIELSESGGAVGTVFTFIGSIFKEFPAIWGGIFAALRAFADNFKKTFQNLGLRAESLAVKFKKLGKAITGGDTTELNNRLKEIDKQIKQNNKSAESLGAAYTRGFNETKEAQKAFKEENDKATIAAEKQQKAAERLEAAKKKAAEAEKQRIKKLQADRKKALQDLEKNSLARLSIITNLANELQALEIQAIKDSTEKQIAEENFSFEQRIKARKKGFDDLVNEAVKEEARLQALFGFGSAELLEFTKKSEAEILEVQKAFNRLSEEDERQHQNKLQNIRQSAASVALQEEKEFFEDEQKELTEGEKAISAALAKVRADRKTEEEEEEEKKKEKIKQTTAAVIDAVNTTIQAISDISALAFAAENERFEQAIQSRKNNISKLNEDLQTATGLQKKFLLQQVKQEEEALQKETEAREKAQKKQAETQKAIALVQAIVAGALGIANAFTLVPPASFIAAAATAVATGVQIATIASQKFAEGGILSGPSHSSGGIKTAFGELEGGEAVINKKSTKLFRPILSALNRAGGGRSFAEGGILGAPISAPLSISSGASVNENFNRFIQATAETTAAINNRIDKITVIQDLNNLQDIQENDNTLNTLTTF
jgi:HAMP domain-containing protein